MTGRRLPAPVPARVLAQVNVARVRAAIGSAEMHGFLAAVDPVYRLAEASAGFVWRLPAGGGHAVTTVEDAGFATVVNVALWESYESLHAFVDRSQHGGFVRQRARWFQPTPQPSTALWWVTADERPTADEALARLRFLRRHGPTAGAFSVRRRFDADGRPVTRPVGIDRRRSRSTALAFDGARVRRRPNNGRRQDRGRPVASWTMATTAHQPDEYTVAVPRVALVCAIVALAVGAIGALGLVRAEARVATRTVTVDGVPMIEMSPANHAGRAPAVVVAHGRAASARLMRGFGDTLVARGYVVVLPDFTGHGANAARLTSGTTGSPDVLQDDLDTAVRHLRSLPTVDPGRIGLIGHSMGAAAVTRYAVAHPDIRATVAISLRSVDGLPADATRPRNLLLLVGAAEMRGFREAALAGVRLADPSAGLGATTGDPAAGTARRAVSVAAVEHISVLYSTLAHRESADWLDAALGRPIGRGAHPRERLLPGALLLLAFVLGFVPLARMVLPARDAVASRTVPRRYAYPGLALALAAGVFGAGLLPTTRLPLSVGGYSAGFFALVGAVLAAVALFASRRGPEPARSPAVPSWRLGVAGVLLAGYAVAAIAVPTHLALTAAVPVGARWWLLPIVVACVALFLFGAHRLAAGSPWRLLVVLATTAAAILVATLAGLGPAFVLLVLPVLVVQLAWTWVWSLVLARRAAPLWLAAVLGAIVVGWPIAMSMPLGAG